MPVSYLNSPIRITQLADSHHSSRRYATIYSLIRLIFYQALKHPVIGRSGRIRTSDPVAAPGPGRRPLSTLR
jgi:hypothetical protein